MSTETDTLENMRKQNVAMHEALHKAFEKCKKLTAERDELKAELENVLRENDKGGHFRDAYQRGYERSLRQIAELEAVIAQK